MSRKTRRINKRRTRRRTHRSKKMRGGGSCNAVAPTAISIPSSVGVPYNAADLNPKGNLYAYNPNVEQWPDQSNAIFDGPMFKMNGGRKRRNSKGKKSKGKKSKGKKTKYGKTKYGKTKYFKTQYVKKQRGGGFTEFITALVPEEIVTMTRALPAGVGHMYDRFNGATPAASSMVYPTNQPLVPKIAIENITAPADIVGIYNQKNNLVSGI